METRSLVTGAVRAVLVLAAAGLLSFCAPPLGNSGGGNLRIVLGGGTGARALSPQTIAGFSYHLDFFGPRGETLSRTLAPGTQTLTLNLALGDWTIWVGALNPEGVLYGSGETTVTVKAGTNEAPVAMSVPSFLTTIAAIRAYLAAASCSTAASVLLPVALDLTDTGGNGWTDLLTAINSANKYVILDLSASTINGMTSNPGEFDPDYTISTGKSRIVSLVLPDTAESIAAGTPDYPLDSWLPSFRYFTGLTSITGRNLTGTDGIGHYAFNGCTSLTSVHFPEVTFIGDSAFEGCTGLTKITLPASLTTIGLNPFAGCAGLANIIVEPGNPNYRAENGMLFSTTGGDTLISYPSAAGTITLPGITLIGESAFQDCTALQSVTLPSATKIGFSAFEGCTGLLTVDLPMTTTVEDNAFSLCSSLTTVDLSSAGHIDNMVFYGCTALETVKLGGTVPTLGEYMFDEISGPQTVTVKVPSAATIWDNIRTASPYAGTDFTDNWGNGFRGGGWNGSNMTATIPGDVINQNITLIVDDTP